MGVSESEPWFTYVLNSMTSRLVHHPLSRYYEYRNRTERYAMTAKIETQAPTKSPLWRKAAWFVGMFGVVLGIGLGLNALQAEPEPVVEVGGFLHSARVWSGYSGGDWIALQTDAELLQTAEYMCDAFDNGRTRDGLFNDWMVRSYQDNGGLYPSELNQTDWGAVSDLSITHFCPEYSWMLPFS